MHTGSLAFCTHRSTFIYIEGSDAYYISASDLYYVPLIVDRPIIANNTSKVYKTISGQRGRDRVFSFVSMPSLYLINRCLKGVEDSEFRSPFCDGSRTEKMDFEKAFKIKRRNLS